MLYSGAKGTMTPNPFIEGTASGLRPPAAPHIKRWVSRCGGHAILSSDSLHNSFGDYW